MKSSIILIYSASLIFTEMTFAEKVESPKPFIKENADCLIFKDGGTLYGKLHGISPTSDIHWTRIESNEVTTYPQKEISQICLNSGRPVGDASQNSFVSLSNGDKIPAKVIGISDGNYNLKTSFTEDLTISTTHVVSYHPSSSDDTLTIDSFGSYSGWKNTTINYSRDPAQTLDGEDWEQFGASWYGTSPNMNALHNPDLRLPDNFILNFTLAYRGTPRLNLAFHRQDISDFIDKEKDDIVVDSGSRKLPYDEQILAKYLGNSVNLMIAPTYPTLSLRHFDKESNKLIHQGLKSISTPRMQLSPSLVMEIEVRASRKDKTVHLYNNGIPAGSWQLSEEHYPKTGNQFIFTLKNSINGASRLSNIRIQRWNGINDPISSASMETKDVMILSNEVDRFSGEIQDITKNTISFKTDYTELSIPSSQVKELHFSTQNIAPTSNEEKEQTIFIKFYDNSSITGIPIKSTDSAIYLSTDYIEEIAVPIKYINSIQFGKLDEIVSTFINKF